MCKLSGAQIHLKIQPYPTEPASILSLYYQPLYRLFLTRAIDYNEMRILWNKKCFEIRKGLHGRKSNVVEFGDPEFNMFERITPE
jgi:hypothetical protein